MLVTGASSGIGEATARRLAREPNSSLVLIARREERLRALSDELGGTFLALDLVDDDAPESIRDHVLEHYGRLDLLVNNAGASWRARFAEGGYENVQRTMAINFDAQVRLTDALLPLLRSSAPSAIVNVASTAAASRAPAPARKRLQVRPRRLVRRAVGRGAPARRARRARAPRLHLHRGLPPVRAHRQAVDALDRLHSRARRRRHLRGRSRRRPERYVPRAYALAAALRVIAPRSCGARSAAAPAPSSPPPPDPISPSGATAPGPGPTASVQLPRVQREHRALRVCHDRDPGHLDVDRPRDLAAAQLAQPRERRSRSSTPKYTSQFGGDGGVSPRMPPLKAPFSIPI